MNKKLLALAVTSALTGVSAGVNADTANVNVYGKLYVQFQTVSGKGSASGTGDLVSHQEVNDPNSYIGFKGEETLGGGMKGWFQVESRLRTDTGNGNWASRNSAAGLSGGFGNIFLGRWDTVYKQLGDPVSFLGISSGNFVSSSALLSTPGDVDEADFHLRQNNYIEYDSPTFAGITIMAAYSPDEQKTFDTNKYLQSVGVKFEGGPLYLALAQERHNDYFGGSNGLGLAVTPGTRSKDTATRFSAMVKLPTNTSIGIDIARIEYKESGGLNGFEKAEHKAASLVATQQLGKFTIAASAQKAEKLKVNGTEVPDSEATQINLGVKYDFSKRTSVYAIASKLTNKDNAVFNNLVPSGTSVNPGVDTEQVGAGIIVSF